jgi:Asp-tRNA(Asn)/Glu-tRNA(Gln) amidotransferase B subunit
VVIGIETHAQLKSRHKLFSRMSLAAITSTVIEQSNRRIDIWAKG